MEKIAIIAVGYNRPQAIYNLLESIVNADYQSDSVDLIISIDKGAHQNEIIEIANQLSWHNGNKILRVFNERQGLRSHIIQCGDYTSEYDAVIVLEDDILVSQAFYQFAKQALNAYEDEHRIAGISLYKHLFHPGVSRPFEPQCNEYDAYLMQFAQSWGQCWSRKMWNGFKQWYNNGVNANLSADQLLPNYVTNWNEHSWLKYYMRYIVECNKYFVYPSVSLTTNVSEVGQHSKQLNNDYQVMLLQGSKHFSFPSFGNAIRYDAFFEREGIQNAIFQHYRGKKVLDLYGCRLNFSGFDYVVSTRNLPYQVVESCALSRRPIEQNIITPSSGTGIFLYNLSCPGSNEQFDSNILTRYDVKGVHWKRLLRLGLSGFFSAVSNRLLHRHK